VPLIGVANGSLSAYISAAWIEMHAFLFSFGFIWTLASVGSILLGPFVGLNRRKIKEELEDFRRNTPKTYWKRIPILIVFWIALIGLIIPMMHPIIGFVIGALVFVLSVR
jgi:hypothetical protein